MNPIIKIENLSKQYRLGTIGTGTLRNDFKRWLYRIRGREDPFLKIGDTNERKKKSLNEYVWALKDINLEVMPGEVMGIIGKNGAGKSTLLKILSKVTGPTTGTISFNGRIGSLLEVGTGFHSELTGRENIFLNGAILGMTKAEIKNKLDEIIDFSGCERYIDTPVKRYSSGMTVRLGFAVAAHLEPEILVVDEVLAVGDIEFQKKAIGKMQDVSRKDGRTVLFVSHNMGAIQRLCGQVVILENGHKTFIGEPLEAIKEYLQSDIPSQSGIRTWTGDNNIALHPLYLLELTTEDSDGKRRDSYHTEEEIFIRIRFHLRESLKGFRFNITLKSTQDEIVLRTSSHDLTKSYMKKGEHVLSCIIPSRFLNRTRYVVNINAGIPGVKRLLAPIDLLTFTIVGKGQHGSSFNEPWPGLVAPKLSWTIE